MKNTYDVAAYFWPAYHDEPRWRRFMPLGDGEWETVRSARPKFEGHYQPRVPLWGYENEADPEAMEKKLDTAARYGVNVFIFDWYWYENQPFLEEALNQGYLRARNNDQVKFYLMWANHNASTLWDLEHSHDLKMVWPGAVDRTTFTTLTDRVIERYFKHPSYYKIDGRPVFSIYELSVLLNGLGGVRETRAALDDFRKRTRAAGFPDLHLQVILANTLPATAPERGGTATRNHTVVELGIDSLASYQWGHVPPKGEYRDWAEKSIPAWEAWTDEFDMPYYPHVSVGWDTNPRFKEFIPTTVTGSTPELFGRYMERAFDFIDAHQLNPRLVTVNSWNEWTEGSYLEPDVVFGLGFLEALQAAREAKTAVLAHA